jgi:hypothetical protein
VASGDYSGILSGENNLNEGFYSLIAGGKDNSITSANSYNVILGGDVNTISVGATNTLVYGRLNSINNGGTQVVFGFSNTGGADYSTILGGRDNVSSDRFNTILGSGGSSYTPSEIVKSGSNSPIQISEILVEGQTVGSGSITLQTLARATYPDIGGSVQDIYLPNNTFFSGVVDLVGVMSTGDVVKRRNSISIRNVSGVITIVEDNTVAAYTYTDAGFGTVTLLMATGAAGYFRVLVNQTETNTVNWSASVRGTRVDIPA